MRLGMILVLATTFCSFGVNAAPVSVSFGGVLNQFNTGPFAANTAFSGSFVLDDSVSVSTGNRFLEAVDNLSLTIGEYHFSGSNGNLQQVDLTSGDDALMFHFGPGDLTGSVGGKTFETMSLELRGADLFADVSQMLSQTLVTGDFNYVSALFDFGGTADWAIARGNEFNLINVNGISAVPVPAAAFLFMPALLGLIGFRRASQKNS